MQLPTFQRRRAKVKASASHSSKSSGSGTVRTVRSTVHHARSRRGDRQGTIFPRRQRPSTVIRRVVLLGLISISLVLITVTARTDALSGPRSVAMDALAPIETGLARAWDPIAHAWNWCARLLHATSENQRLQKRVDELEAQTVVTRSIEQENARLRDVLYLNERGRFPGGFRQVAGSVIARSPTDIDRSITIDLGAEDGVKINDPVMVSRGLIGRVEAVSRNAARVGLVINPQQAVSAKVVDGSASGVLRSSVNDGSPVMELSYVTQRVKVSAGDLVVTSGWTTDGGNLRSIFPSGIPVGVVSSVGNSPADLYKTVQVTPFADFDRIETVLVLVADRSSTITTFEVPQTPEPAPVARRIKRVASEKQKQRSKRPVQGRRGAQQR